MGVADVETYIPVKGMKVSPHNAFIFIALASGVVPLVFFIVYWVRLFIKGLSADAGAQGPMRHFTPPC